LQTPGTISRTGIAFETAAWRVTKNLHLRSYKITQVQVIEEGDYERRMHFCNWFLEVVKDGVLDLTEEALFHLSGYINAQNSTY
jgi:hypothetical protein